MPGHGKAMIVAAQPEAAEAGAVVLKRGGNAVDAAMAAALVQGVVDPQMCGIAGFGSCQIYLPGRGVHTCIDFHGRVPAAARPEMWANRIVGETRDGFGFLLEGQVNDIGYQAVEINVGEEWPTAPCKLPAPKRTPRPQPPWPRTATALRWAKMESAKQPSVKNGRTTSQRREARTLH